MVEFPFPAIFLSLSMDLPGPSWTYLDLHGSTYPPMSLSTYLSTCVFYLSIHLFVHLPSFYWPANFPIFLLESVCLSVCLSTYLSNTLSICQLSIYQYINLSIDQSINLPIYLSIYLPFNPSIDLSIYLPIDLSTYLST